MFGAERSDPFDPGLHFAQAPALTSVTGPASTPGSAKSFADWVPVIATGAAFFMIILDTSIVNLALARIGIELHAGLSTQQWVVDGYALVFATLLSSARRTADFRNCAIPSAERSAQVTADT